MADLHQPIQNLIIAKQENCTIIQRNHDIYVLEKDEALVWTLLEKGSNLHTIAENLQKKIPQDISFEEVCQQIKSFLEQMESEGIVSKRVSLC